MNLFADADDDDDDDEFSLCNYLVLYFNSQLFSKLFFSVIVPDIQISQFLVWKMQTAFFTSFLRTPHMAQFKLRREQIWDSKSKNVEK